MFNFKNYLMGITLSLIIITPTMAQEINSAETCLEAIYKVEAKATEANLIASEFSDVLEELSEAERLCGQSAYDLVERLLKSTEGLIDELSKD